jgi:hypothetical protein
MVGHGAKFPHKKEQAIAALLTHRTVAEAASGVGISTRTLLRWMKEPEFRVAVQEARHRTFELAIGRLQDNAAFAVNTVLKTMVDPNAPATVRLKAADLVLNFGARSTQMEDIAARVAKLEKAAGGRQTSETVIWPGQKALPSPKVEGGGDGE